MANLADRSSRPSFCPHQMPAPVEQRVGCYIEDFDDGDLEVDEFVLLDYAEAGELDFDDIYETAPAS